MLQEKILNDYKEAMKNKNGLKVSTLSFLRAAMQNMAIDKRKDSLDDGDVISLIRKQIKQRQDSIEQFQKGNRQDLADKETKEMEILKSYLPKGFSPDEIKIIIEEAIMSTNAAGIKDMGKVMKEVTLNVAGRAEGKLVSDLVKERLSKGI